jgi:hypothetical protein
LTSVTFADPSGCPAGEAPGAKYECCGISKLPPPPPPPSSCSDGFLGDGVTCEPYVDLKAKLADVCAATGGTLSSVMFADPSGCPAGEAPGAKYECCGPSK